MELSFGSDEYFMQQALIQARMAADEGEIPVGAVVVSEKKIIAKAYNQTERLNDVTAHAEMLALTSAFNFLGAKYLADAIMYVTLEPCTMCAGALYWSQLGRLVIGAKDERRGYSRLSSSGESIIHPKTEITTGVLAAECSEIVTNFFLQLRRKSN
jgi:tRNA(adenine34) deaminase